MIRLEPYKIVLTNADLEIRDWQRAIDAQDFLFRLELVNVRNGDGGSLARLHDREVELDIVRPVVASVLNKQHSRQADEWRHAVAARGTGSLESSIAAGLLTLAIAQATDGILYAAADGPYGGYEEQKRGAETLLAAIFGRDDLLRSRYPDAGVADRDEGPVVIRSRISPY